MFTASEAKRLIRRLLDEGDFFITAHALDEMRKDRLTYGDVMNVLRGGVVREAEWERGSWRYRVETVLMCVVIALDPESESTKADDVDAAKTTLVVVTAWRKS